MFSRLSKANIMVAWISLPPISVVYIQFSYMECYNEICAILYARKRPPFLLLFFMVLFPNSFLLSSLYRTFMAAIKPLVVLDNCCIVSSALLKCLYSVNGHWIFFHKALEHLVKYMWQSRHTTFRTSRLNSCTDQVVSALFWLFEKSKPSTRRILFCQKVVLLNLLCLSLVDCRFVVMGNVNILTPSKRLRTWHLDSSRIVKIRLGWTAFGVRQF